MVEHQAKVRPEKVEAIKQIRESLERSSAALLTEYRGLSVTELAELRTKLSEASAEYRVVKNTLTLRAASELGIEGLDALLEGPTAVAYCFGDPVSAAKALSTFARDHAALVVKGGVLDGKPLDADGAAGLATVDPAEVSLAKITGLLQAPLANIAAMLEAPLSRIAFVLEQIAARGEAQA